MSYPKDLEIGFELEFGHDITKKAVIAAVSKAFPDVKWGRGKHKFNLVPDGSVWTRRAKDSELVTPAWSANEAVRNLYRLFCVLEEIGASTNHTTGIHVNIGWKNPYEIESVSPLKLLVYSNEEKWLKRFDREGNKWCLPYRRPLKTIAKRIKFNENFIDRLEDKMDSMNNTKNRFINFDKVEYGYIEFRGLGGVDYHKKYALICDAIADFVIALNKSTEEDDNAYYRRLKRYLDLH